jgi:hypothetical protein
MRSSDFIFHNQEINMDPSMEAEWTYWKTVFNRIIVKSFATEQERDYVKTCLMKMLFSTADLYMTNDDVIYPLLFPLFQASTNFTSPFSTTTSEQQQRPQNEQNPMANLFTQFNDPSLSLEELRNMFSYFFDGGARNSQNSNQGST